MGCGCGNKKANANKKGAKTAKVSKSGQTRTSKKRTLPVSGTRVSGNVGISNNGIVTAANGKTYRVKTTMASG